MAFADKKEAFRYINQYQKEKYDRITILRPAGDKAIIEAIAKERGMSTSQFINQCIDEKIKRMKK